MKKKSIIAVLSAVVLMVVASLALVFTIGPKTSADSEVIETVPVGYLNLTNDGKTLGDNSYNSGNAFNADGKTWIKNHKKYHVEIPNTVTQIGKAAFYIGCSGLTSITIPSSVTSIGISAFGCCSGLTSITIPSSVTSIGDGAFGYCSGLTSITIPSSVTSIGDAAFYYCSGLTSMTVDPNNTKYTSRDNEGNECNCIIKKSSNGLFSGCQNTIIPSGVTAIEYSAFRGSGLTSITIPGTVTSIGYWAFLNCSVTSVTFAESSQLTSIGTDAFSGCRGLTSITIPDSVTSISYGAFSGCSGLTSINIPDSVTTIGECAFSSCSGLTSMTVDPNNTKYTSQDNEGHECNCIVERLTNMLISGCQNTIIPDGVTSIGNEAFYCCYGLTSINIPSSVTSIGRSAFYYCSGLTSMTVDPNNTLYTSQDNEGHECNCIIEKSSNKLLCGCQSTIIPEGVTSIGSAAFGNCSGLTSITIPEGVTSIDYTAFLNCSGLTSITIPSSVTSIGNGAFGNCSGLNEIIVRNPDLMTNTNLQPYASKLHYGAEQNTVTFNINGGTATPQTIDFGECATEPTFVGYHVSNWYLDEQHAKPFTFDTPIKYDITLYGDSEINRYMVDFNGQGAYVNSVFVNHGDLVAEPTISRTGYTLLGWFVDDEIDQKFNFNTPITDNIGLWAKWSINQYNVIFDSNGGNAVAPQRNVEYNTLLTVPETPTREGYNFLGWYNGDEAYDFATPVSQDMTLTAKWESNQPDEPETPDEETSTEVNNQNNNGLLWGILGTSGGILLVGGIVFGIVIAKRRRK